MKLKISYLVVVLAFVLGCGSEKESDKVGDAQICMNKVTSGTPSVAKGQVDLCLAKVSGLESKSASGVRCNGGFISEGFASPQKYINALDTLKGTGGATSFMGLITFTSSGNVTSDTTNAQTTFNECLTSGAKGTTIISSFGYFAMAMYRYMTTAGAGCSTSPTASGYDINACTTAFVALGAVPLIEMFNFSSTTQSTIDFQSGLGSVLASTYTLSCASSSANADMCSLLNKFSEMN